MIPASLIFRLKRHLPRTLYGRTLMIIVTPVILAQLLATFVFFDRHWSTMTQRLSTAVAGEVGMISELLILQPRAFSFDTLHKISAQRTGLTFHFVHNALLPAKERQWPDPLRIYLERALDERLRRPFLVQRDGAGETVVISVQLPHGILRVTSPESRLSTPTTEIFIGWMLGSSILLSIIALAFMRNQIRPIRRLADAAEAFGKGRDVPGFKPEGAIEVRQAASALVAMRDRLRKHITQRTTMLAGVSHDLRTPLTRMKLQLALMPDSEAVNDLKTDIDEMDAMVEAYLAFARGEESENTEPTSINYLLIETIRDAERVRDSITFIQPNETILLPARPRALKRCLTNLIVNALRYGDHVQVSTAITQTMVWIYIDDDGPGIAEDQREDVFRPFVRLDESRGSNGGSVGLGLTIARDIARLHGGDVTLDKSPMGGARAIMRIPR